MNAITKILLPVALLFACDTEDGEDIESTELAAESNHEGESRRGRGGPMRLDTDKDGAISQAEAAGHRIAAKFAELDADKDGKLSRDELRAMKGRGGKHGGGKRHGDPAERANHLVQKFDADKDGSLSAAELADHPRLAGKFAGLDADKDGKLGLTELQAIKGRGGKRDPAERAAHFMARADVDTSGSLSLAEVADHPRLAGEFAAIDTNGDGALSMAELSAFKPRPRGERGFGPRGERGRERTDRG